MELIHSYQLLFNEIQPESFDLVITGTGIEARCTYLIDNLELAMSRKIAVSHGDSKKSLFTGNYDKTFKKDGFEILGQDAQQEKHLTEYLQMFCNQTSNGNLKILVDYSCMKKKWYSSILEFFACMEFEHIHEVSLFFSYTPGAFIPYQKPKRIEEIQPVFNFKHTGLEKPPAMIIGLGCEEGLAEMVIYKSKPNISHIFMADPAFDPEYVNAVMQIHKGFIENTDNHLLHAYAIHNLDGIQANLSSVALNLRLEHRLSIAPLGPKPFGLICMLLALQYPDIEVLEITTSKSSQRKGCTAIHAPLVYKVVFQNADELDYY